MKIVIELFWFINLIERVLRLELSNTWSIEPMRSVNGRTVRFLGPQAIIRSLVNVIGSGEMNEWSP